MKLKTSNDDKIKEFKAYFPNLEIVKGPDIKEVLPEKENAVFLNSDRKLDEITTTILYKSLDSNPGEIVEDTILVINGEVKVDIKWNIDLVKEGDDLEWITSIAYNDGQDIYISKASLKGVGTRSKGDEGFAFDPYFIPKSLINLPAEHVDYSIGECTLAMLAKANLKKFFSARIKALESMKAKRVDLIVQINNIKPWEGKYQNEG